MCEWCKGFADRENYRDLAELKDIARQLEELVKAGVFHIKSGLEDLEYLLDKEGSQYPETLAIEFVCSTCQSLFILHADLIPRQCRLAA